MQSHSARWYCPVMPTPWCFRIYDLSRSRTNCVGFHRRCGGTKKIAMAQAVAASIDKTVLAGEDSFFQIEPEGVIKSVAAIKQGTSSREMAIHQNGPGNKKLTRQRAMAIHGSISRATL